MKTSTIFAAVATLGILLGSGTAALAWQHGGGYNGGYGGQGMYGSYNCPYYGNGGQAITPEKQIAIDTILKDSDSRMRPIMDQYNAKRMELDALSGNSNAKPEAISKLASEIASLQGQIRTEMDARNAKIETEGGMARGMWGGNGGRRGHGRHGGHGGNCW